MGGEGWGRLAHDQREEQLQRPAGARARVQSWELGPRELRKPVLSETGPGLLAVRAVTTQGSLLAFCVDVVYLTGRPPTSCLVFMCLAFKKPVLLHQPL